MCVCGPQVVCHECLFEGMTAFKRIQMGDRDDDGAVLYGVAQSGFVRLVMYFCECLHVCLLW